MSKEMAQVAAGLLHESFFQLLEEKEIQSS
jgi:hypothetical protein